MCECVCVSERARACTYIMEIARGIYGPGAEVEIRGPHTLPVRLAGDKTPVFETRRRRRRRRRRQGDVAT